MAAPLIRILEGEDYAAEIRRAAASLNSGRLIVLPTETVYGVAGRLGLPDARQRLAILRPRDDGKPMAIHLAAPADAMHYLGPVSELGRRMMRKLWPGPVALVFDVPDDRRRSVAAELGLDESAIYDGEAIMLRCPDHPVTRDVLVQAEGPVVMTVASTHAGTAAPRLANLADDLGDRVDLVLDTGPTQFSKPSTIVRVMDDRYEIVREGVYDQRIIERLLRTTILFVCSGNTCRSPMAEAITRKLLADRLGVAQSELAGKGYQVLSAGALAMPGAPAAIAAAEVVAEMGGDLSRHRSQPLTVELIHQADAIFAMGAAHARAVVSLVPSAADKVDLLSPAGEIDDPIGADVSVYRTLAGQLQQFIEQRLKERALL